MKTSKIFTIRLLIVPRRKKARIANFFRSWNFAKKFSCFVGFADQKKKEYEDLQVVS